MKKIRYILLGLLFFSLLSTCYVAFATNGAQNDNKYAGENLNTKSKPIPILCFWMTSGWDGAITVDCYGCIIRPMADPRLMGTCN